MENKSCFCYQSISSPSNTPLIQYYIRTWLWQLDKNKCSLFCSIRFNEYKNKNKSTFHIPNKNICVPIGPIFAVQFFYEKISFYDIFNKRKSRSLDFNSLLIGLVSYKLTDIFSIKEASKWLTQRLFNIFWNRQDLLLIPLAIGCNHLKIQEIIKSV